MRRPSYTKAFLRDYKKLRSSGRRNMQKLDTLMRILIEEKHLPSNYRNHKLKGNKKHLFDCHVEGDWVLLYELKKISHSKEQIIFHRTGKHSTLFQ